MNAQFIELYNEEVIDLIEPAGVSRISQLNESMQEYMTSNYSHLTLASNQSAPCKPKIEIHEDQYGGIYINGCSNKNVYSVKEVILFIMQNFLFAF